VISSQKKGHKPKAIKTFRSSKSADSYIKSKKKTGLVVWCPAAWNASDGSIPKRGPRRKGVESVPGLNMTSCGPKEKLGSRLPSFCFFFLLRRFQVIFSLIKYRMTEAITTWLLRLHSIGPNRAF